MLKCVSPYDRGEGQCQFHRIADMMLADKQQRHYQCCEADKIDLLPCWCEDKHVHNQMNAIWMFGELITEVGDNGNV